MQHYALLEMLLTLPARAWRPTRRSALCLFPQWEALLAQNLRKMIRTAAKRADLKKRVYPHLLIHSLATNLLHRGAHLLASKEQLGHAFVETTMIYVHSSPEHTQLQYRMYAPSYL